MAESGRVTEPGFGVMAKPMLATAAGFVVLRFMVARNGVIPGFWPITVIEAVLAFDPESTRYIAKTNVTMITTHSLLRRNRSMVLNEVTVFETR